MSTSQSSTVLTRGAVRRIKDGESSDKSFQPILQLTQINHVRGESRHDQYRVTVSDGHHFMQGMLATQLNSLVESRRITNNSIVKVMDSRSYDVHDRGGVLLLRIEVTNASPGQRCGNPTNIEEEGRVSEASSAESTKLIADLRSLMYDEDLSDVTLQGTDGESVPAIKALLASRSAVFRRMLYGHFTEANSQVVRLGFRGAVVKAVVEFCYTARVEFPCDCHDEDTVRSIVGLLAAGQYFDLPGLAQNGFDIVCEAMSKCKPLACAVLDETMILGDPTGRLGIIAKHIIRMDPVANLLPPKESKHIGIRSLSSPAICELMADDKMQADETTMLRCLIEWARSKSDVASAASQTGGKRKHSEVEEDRSAIAQEIIRKSIELSHIAPSHLDGFVRESELVAEQEIMLALKKQALMAEEEGDIRGLFSRVRHKGQSGGLVIVMGAGTDAVNGAYVPTNHPGQYAKEGTYEGQQQVFTLHYQYPQWRLVVGTPRRLGEDGDELCLYRADYPAYHHGFPRDKWVSSRGEDAPPSCIWIADDSSPLENVLVPSVEAASWGAAGHNSWDFAPHRQNSALQRRGRPRRDGSTDYTSNITRNGGWGAAR